MRDAVAWMLSDDVGRIVLDWLALPVTSNECEGVGGCVRVGGGVADAVTLPAVVDSERLSAIEADPVGSFECVGVGAGDSVRDAVSGTVYVADADAERVCEPVAVRVGGGVTVMDAVSGCDSVALG